MSQKSYTSRLKQDYIRLKQDPVPYIHAEFLPSNILEWHYIIQGPADSPFKGGYYHGSLIFTKDFPFKPPSIYMYTPNGRFKPNKRLCLSISDFHPDTWNPAWSVGTILTGLLSFMLEKSPTLGSIESTDLEKRSLAFKSVEFNLKDKFVLDLFPDVVEEMKQIVIERAKAAAASPKRSGTTITTEIVGAPASNLQSIIATAVVAIGFAAFAFSVKYVLRSITYDE